MQTQDRCATTMPTRFLDLTVTLKRDLKTSAPSFIGAATHPRPRGGILSTSHSALWTFVSGRFTPCCKLPPECAGGHGPMEPVATHRLHLEILPVEITDRTRETRPLRSSTATADKLGPDSYRLNGPSTLFSHRNTRPPFSVKL